jgi:hypothetical protein
VFCLHALFAQELTVTKVNILGDYEVYSPTYYHNNLVVCSNKKDEVFLTIKDASNKYPINLYLIEIQKNDSLVLQPFDKALRTKLNDGPITFNEKFTQCFISQNYQNLKKENNNLKIENYLLNNGTWVKEPSFTFNNPAYSLTHPMLNGNELIFSSNMPGGYGGFDLWKSVKTEGVWSKPINMGSNINSASNEIFPTRINNELYYSSDRDGYGGLDIYKTDLLENNPPILLPKPINSNFDDFSLIGKSALEDGYFSSNRGGKDEIYKFSYKFPEFNNCDSIIENNFCYTLYEESAMAIPNQEALIYKWTINGEKRKGPEVKYCFPGPGDYEIILDVEDTISHINYDDQSHMNITLDNVMKPYITSVDTIQVNTQFYMGAMESYLPYMANKKYFWTIENKNMTGEQISYVFNRTGKYKVQLGIIGFEDTIKVSDCVYKTIVCVDKNLVQTLNNDFKLVKNELGNSYKSVPNKINPSQIGETFTLNSLIYDEKGLSKKEKEDLIYLVRFLKKHPNVFISISYYLDAIKSNTVLKNKVTNIIKFLIVSGINNHRIKMIEKAVTLDKKTNVIEFNFNIYENN